MSTKNGNGKLRVTPWMKPYRWNDDDPTSEVVGYSERGEDGMFVCDRWLWSVTRIKRPTKDQKSLRVWVQRNVAGVLKLNDSSVPFWGGGTVGRAHIIVEQKDFLSAAGINPGDRFDCWVEWEAA